MHLEVKVITSYPFMPKLTCNLFHYQKYSQIPESKHSYDVRPPGTIIKKSLLNKAGPEHLINSTKHFIFYTQTVLKHIKKYY